MTTPDHAAAPDDLVKQLRERHNRITTRLAGYLVNPDGPEAADAIEALRADLRHVIAERDKTFAAVLTRAEAAEAELRIHRERAASLNNMWRHEFSREVEAAADKLFARMAWPRKEIRALAQGSNDG